MLFEPHDFSPWGAAGDRHYPALRADAQPPFVELDAADGRPEHFWVDNLVFMPVQDSDSDEFFRIKGRRTLVLVTNTRLVFTCPDVAPRRAPGIHMRGQIKYQWMIAVGARLKKGLLTGNDLAIIVGQHPALTHVNFELPPTIDPPTVAADIVRRAARYRLASGETLDPAERAELERMSQAQPVPPVKRDYGWHEFPSYVSPI